MQRRRPPEAGLAQAVRGYAEHPSYIVASISLRMKLMRSFVRQGANHSHSHSYGEDLQRSTADEGAISCQWFDGTMYSSTLGVGTQQAAILDQTVDVVRFIEHLVGAQLKAFASHVLGGVVGQHHQLRRIGQLSAGLDHAEA